MAQRKATVPDRRVGLPAPACVIVAVRLNKALIKTRTAPASPEAAMSNPRPACGPVEGFVRPSLGVRCSKNI